MIITFSYIPLHLFLSPWFNIYYLGSPWGLVRCFVFFFFIFFYCFPIVDHSESKVFIHSFYLVIPFSFVSAQPTLEGQLKLDEFSLATGNTTGPNFTYKGQTSAKFGYDQNGKDGTSVTDFSVRTRIKAVYVECKVFIIISNVLVLLLLTHFYLKGAYYYRK